MMNQVRSLRMTWLAIYTAVDLALVVTSAGATCTLGAVAVLPLAERSNQFAFAADINGKQATLLVDTGFFATTLNLAAAERLGVTLGRSDNDTYGVGGVRHMYHGTVRRMRLGNLNADHMDVAAEEIWPAGSDGGLDGVLGMNMMSAYDIDVDAVGKHLILYEADGSCARPTVALAPTLYSVPLEAIYHDRQADILVSINGRQIKAMLDTGASGSMMYRAVGRRLGLDLSGLRVPGHRTVRGVGPLPVAAIRHVFPKIVIGDLQINNMPIDIIDQESNGIDRHHVGSLIAGAIDSDEPNGEEMLLGADFMEKVHVWISHSSQTLIMQYPPVASTLPH